MGQRSVKRARCKKGITKKQELVKYQDFPWDKPILVTPERARILAETREKRLLDLI